MLPPAPEFVCAPVKTLPARDKGVSLIGLPEITTNGGLAWPAAATVLLVVVVPVAPVGNKHTDQKHFCLLYMAVLNQVSEVILQFHWFLLLHFVIG